MIPAARPSARLLEPEQQRTRAWWRGDVSPSSLQGSGSKITTNILVYSQGFKGTEGVEV